jgi:hypothetical protein
MSEEPPNNKRFVALFKDSYQWETVFSTKTEDEDYTLSGYCRVTEWLEVEFKPLPPAEILNSQVNSLQKERKDIVANFQEKLASIDDRLSQLLALTGPEQEVQVISPAPRDDDIPF